MVAQMHVRNLAITKSKFAGQLVEKVVVNEVRRLIYSPEQIHYILEKFQSELAKLQMEVPDLLLEKITELQSEEKRLSNYIAFIGEGSASRTLNEALLECEKKVDSLRTEIDGMRRAQDNVFQVPSIDWIAERQYCDGLLQHNTGEPALVLRTLLGPMALEPQLPESGKPYYVAHSSINALAIAEPLPGRKDLDNGATTFQWWARKDSNLRPMDYESTALTN